MKQFVFLFYIVKAFFWGKKVIVLITGVPGSGKSYYAVHEVIKLFKKYDDKVLILSNISNLTKDKIESYLDKKVNYLNIENDLIKHKKEFFDNEYQEKFLARLRNKFPGVERIVYFIDEAQRFLGVSSKVSQEIVFFFDYHRHYGVDIYLITQHARKIIFGISSLAEYEVQGFQQSKVAFNRLKYRKLLDNFVFDKFSLKKDNDIFNLYSSVVVQSEEKYLNVALKYYIYIVLSVLFVFGLSFAGFIQIKHFFFRNTKPKNTKKINSSGTAKTDKQLKTENNTKDLPKKFFYLFTTGNRYCVIVTPPPPGFSVTGVECRKKNKPLKIGNFFFANYATIKEREKELKNFFTR